LRSLETQSHQSVEVIVVDNSGSGRARDLLPEGSAAHVIENQTNLGFGGAVNQGIDRSQSDYIAILNDDAIAHRDWIAALVRVMESHPDVGMCASCVQLQDGSGMDSAGMLICADASSTQRGHGLPFSQFAQAEEVLLPSGSAAMYRRTMLTATGAFDPTSFFIARDTDLGLRAVRAGWRCLYCPMRKWSTATLTRGRAFVAKGLLCRAESAVGGHQELPAGCSQQRRRHVARVLLHAVFLRKAAESGAIAKARDKARVARRAGSPATVAELPRSSPSDVQSMHVALTSAEFERILRVTQSSETGGLPLSRTFARAYPGADRLLILIPCFNEEGAIHDVITGVQRPARSAVLVIDDAPPTARTRSRKHGAHVLALPHHLGLGGAVQAGYKLAFESGFEYVIRVDAMGSTRGRHPSVSTL
jgi:glycosyltransferase involved in cell wall biosynthesis